MSDCGVVTRGRCRDGEGTGEAARRVDAIVTRETDHRDSKIRRVCNMSADGRGFGTLRECGAGRGAVGQLGRRSTSVKPIGREERASGSSERATVEDGRGVDL